MPGDTNVQKLSIALSGCGHAGLSHGREIVACNDWNLAAVCDMREAKLPPHWPTGEAAVEATRMACAAIEAVERDTLTLNNFEQPEPR